MAGITFENINIGGISDSKYQGVENSVAECVGLDIHSEPGIIKANQKLSLDFTPTSFVTNMVSASNGNTYLFGEDGKVWEKNYDYDGEYTLLGTLTYGKVYGACEYNGYIYYATYSRLGRFPVGDFSGRSDSFGTFTNGSPYHPMCVLNLVLYIGDKNFVAQVEDSVFTAKALDLESQYKITALGDSGGELIIGTTIEVNVQKAKIFRWNTWSPSFSSEDSVPESIISAFISVDNSVLVYAGTKGNIYAYTGTILQRFKRVPGNWGTTYNGGILNDAVDSFFGLPLFGFSTYNGSPTSPLGIYSFGSYSNGYPDVLNLEYIISTGDTTGIRIGSICVVEDFILVSWKKGTIYGIDKLDINNKFSGAYFTTRMVQPDREKLKGAISIEVPYRTLPEGTSIKIFFSADDGTFTEMETVDDTIRKKVYTKSVLPLHSHGQIRVQLITSGNLSPEIEGCSYNPR